MSIRINLTLEASEMFLSLHRIFSLERAAIAWAILERISGFDPSLEMIVPRSFEINDNILKIQNVSPYINHSAVYILFWSFEINDNILRIQK